jgi:hypothetical protein
MNRALLLTLALLLAACEQTPQNTVAQRTPDEDTGLDAAPDAPPDLAADADDGADAAPDLPVDPDLIEVRFEPDADDFFRLPWPSDGRRNDAGGLDMRGFPEADDDILARFLATLEADLDGAANMPVAYMALRGGAPSDASLPTPAASRDPQSPIQWIDLSDEACGLRLPVEASLREGADPFTRAHRLLQVKNSVGAPLRPNTAYALVLLRSFGAPEGKTTARPQPFDDAWRGDGSALSASLEPLRRCLPMTGLDPDEIAAATVFTAQDPVAQMQRLRDAIMDPDLTPTRPIEGLTRSDDWSRWGRGLTTLVGAVPMPIYQDGAAPYDITGGGLVLDDQGTPQVQRWESVPMMIAWKRLDPEPEGPRPVLVFIDGTGWEPWRHLLGAWTNDALNAGFVVASFMPQFHGRRGGFTGSAEISSFNFFNPDAGRTNFRQQAAETSFFLRVLREQAAALPGLPPMDTDEVVYGGHSQGALAGALVAAVEDQYRAYVFNGLSSYLTLTLLYRKEPADFAALLRNFFRLGDALDLFHPIPQLMQAGAEVVDPHNYAPRWRGWAQHPRGNHVFVSNGLMDSTTTPRGMDHLTLSGQLALIHPPGWDIDPLGVHDLDIRPLPIQGNAAALDGQPLTLATYLNADEGHFTIHNRPAVRALAINFWRSALGGAVPRLVAAREFQCGDGADEDDDALLDCADPDCAALAPCAEQRCADGADDDGDGLIDCQDDQCRGDDACVEAACDDGADDDFDGAIDCDDTQCAARAPCGEERCADGADDDGDGAIDCDDDQCAANAACAERNCADGADSDGDGLTDCADPDCAASLLCPERDCQDELDNNNNGLTDCQELFCQARDACPLTPEDNCQDGLDNNEDGAIDCDDPTCAAACAPEGSCADADLGQRVGPGLFTAPLEEADDDFWASDCVPLGEGGGSPDLALRWTAPEGGVYRLSTYGSRADTVLSVYPDACDLTRELGCNDDERPVTTSALNLRIDAGTAVIIVISGYNKDTTGTATLHITRLP